MLHLTECPRDAMQGLHDFIPTQNKIEYINQLLKVGYDTIDFGSFVSPKAIPQLKDTAEVLARLDLDNTNSQLLAIIANERGATDACTHEAIDYLGYPFSISETFQQRNTNASIEESMGRVENIQNLCVKNNKEMVVYISMGFGNPYGEEWHQDIVMKWVEKLAKLDIKIFAISDTVGVATPSIITQLYSDIIPEFKDLHFGAHLHSTKETAKEKLKAAVDSGCTRFDIAMGGLGGCPMAKDDLVGNIASEQLMELANEENYANKINGELFIKASKAATSFFG